MGRGVEFRTQREFLHYIKAISHKCLICDNVHVYWMQTGFKGVSNSSILPGNLGFCFFLKSTSVQVLLKGVGPTGGQTLVLYQNVATDLWVSAHWTNMLKET